MAAVDSSTLISYIRGDSGNDVQKFDAALAVGDVSIPPVVLVEVLCQPNLPQRHIDLIQSFPIIELLDGYWYQAAETRRKLLSLRLRARVADVMIAQCCLDHDLSLIAGDTDYRHFAKHCGLKLA